MKPPFEVYNGNDVADADGHLCSAEDADYAAQIVDALNALDYWLGFAKARMGQMDAEDVAQFEKARAIMNGGKGAMKPQDGEFWIVEFDGHATIGRCGVDTPGAGQRWRFFDGSEMSDIRWKDFRAVRKIDVGALLDQPKRCSADNAGCGTPGCTDPNCDYGKGPLRCQSCGAVVVGEPQQSADKAKHPDGCACDRCQGRPLSRSRKSAATEGEYWSDELNKCWDRSGFDNKYADLKSAALKALNYIENTENELGIKLSCGDALREVLR